MGIASINNNKINTKMKKKTVQGPEKCKNIAENIFVMEFLLVSNGFIVYFIIPISEKR